MSDEAALPQPFIYGRPVRPGEFLNREAELRTVFNRLRNCESTAVVGEPHIGKSSLLLQLADEETQQAYLGESAQRLVVSLLDLHPVGNEYTPTAFWEEALEPLQWIDDATLRQQLEQLAQTNYARRPLERVFNYLGENQQQLVLLLDEFERLLIHPNFQDPAFFALLCSLAARTGGMVLITASRLSVAEMNKRGRSLLGLCSPLFGNLIELRLQPFSHQAAEKLLNRASGVLSPHDLRFVRQVAGRHPFLLQAMVATLLEAEGRDRRRRAAERFYKRVSYHLDELWQMLDDRARTGIVILSLMELGGRALGDKFKLRQEEIGERFRSELRYLEDLGLVEQIDAASGEEDTILFWEGRKWSVSTPIAVRWVHDVVIAQTRQIPKYDEWLNSERYKFLLSQARWNSLVGEARNALDWAVKNGAPMMQLLYQVKEWVT
jgi:hypothetical protein